MENICDLSRDDENMELPPGFRFHPTDEELITHYLSPKFLNTNFDAKAIGEVDLNKVEPWDLPWKAKMGEKEWYFFCVRDRKYPTGSRTNRATDAGYWKATGKDREIYRAKTLVGMKKTLVFYKGRAPKGEKTNWVMHEFRLEGKYSMNNLPKTAKNEWVICRIFHKSSGGKKIHISGLVRSSDYGEFRTSNLPPLVDLSHVTCFSNQLEDQKPQDDVSVQNSFFPTQFPPYLGNLQFPDSVWMQDVSIQRLLVDNNGPNLKQDFKAELSQDTGMSTDFSSAVSNREMGQRSYEVQEYPITSDGPLDLDCLWNY